MLKASCEEHSQAAAERCLKWGTYPDADNDNPIRGYNTNDDPEALLTTGPDRD